MPCSSTNWQGDSKTIKDAIKPHHYVYPALSLWQAADTLSARQTIQLPDDIRPLLEQSAKGAPKETDSEALTTFVTDHTCERDKMLGYAKLRDVFNASAIDDKEGTETRYGIKPTALLVILPSAPREQGGRVTWQLPDGTTESHYTGEFNFALAKALQTHATRIPAYLVKPQLAAAPDWLKQHLDSGVLAMRASDSTKLQLDATAEAPYTLHYRHDLGITYEKVEPRPATIESEDFWF